jgi:hypothetical protein
LSRMNHQSSRLGAQRPIWVLFRVFCISISNPIQSHQSKHTLLGFCLLDRDRGRILEEERWVQILQQELR